MMFAGFMAIDVAYTADAITTMSTGQSALLDHVFGGNKALYEAVGLLPLVTVGVYGINYAAKSISSKFAKKATQEIAEETAERLARESIEEAAEKAFKEAGEEAAKKTAMEAGEEVSEKAAMEAGEEVAEKTANELTQEIADNTNQINTTTQEVAENQNSGVYLERGSESGTDTVTYRRVQGGQGTQLSQQRVIIDSEGNVYINKKDRNLNISIDNGEHSQYYIDNNRPGADIYEFEVPKWLDDMVKENTIPQAGYKNNPLNQGGSAPKLTDPSTPGTCIEFPAPWIEWIEEYATDGRIILGGQ